MVSINFEKLDIFINNLENNKINNDFKKEFEKFECIWCNVMDLLHKNHKKTGDFNNILYKILDYIQSISNHNELNNQKEINVVREKMQLSYDLHSSYGRLEILLFKMKRNSFQNIFNNKSPPLIEMKQSEPIEILPLTVDNLHKHERELDEYSICSNETAISTNTIGNLFNDTGKYKKSRINEIINDIDSKISKKIQFYKEKSISIDLIRLCNHKNDKSFKVTKNKKVANVVLTFITNKGPFNVIVKSFTFSTIGTIEKVEKLCYKIRTRLDLDKWNYMIKNRSEIDSENSDNSYNTNSSV